MKQIGEKGHNILKMKRFQVELLQSSGPSRLGVPQGCSSVPQLFVVVVVGAGEFDAPPDYSNQTSSFDS